MEQTQMQKYKTMHGEELALETVNQEGRRLIKEVYSAYKQDKPFAEMLSAIHSPRALSILCNTPESGSYSISESVSSSALYKVLHDLLDRSGVRQNVLHPTTKEVHVPINEASLEELMTK